MFKVNDLIKDNIIDKEKLVLVRSNFLGLEDVQVKFIAKIFAKKRDSYSFNIKEISKIFKTNEDTSMKILQNLVVQGYVSFSIKNDKQIFDFLCLIKKLLETYLPPEKNSSFEQKEFWIQKNIEFILTDKNIEVLKDILEQNEWSDVVKIIMSFKEVKINNWSIFKNIFILEKEKIIKRNIKIKKTLDKNWLV